EKVDIIRWDPDAVKFAAAALKPANIRDIFKLEESHTIRVLVGRDDLSLAIGKRGQNARLTAKLTGWEIETQEDKTAEEAIETQKSEAAQSIAATLDLTEEEAEALAAGGMISSEAIVTAAAEDIAGLLNCDLEKGAKILTA